MIVCTSRVVAACALLIVLMGCEVEAEPTTLTRAQLMDPETCESCHPTHYREWKASMHAYAADDPVFLAMNALGQEETDGELGDFCVSCHAPMAVKEGMTVDGTNLDEVPQHLKGVTCYFCHNAIDVEGDHNAIITLADDRTMRGGIIGAVRPSAHGVAFSRFQDRYNPESSRMCGACHDIMTPTGVHLERTFKEYSESVFGDSDSPQFQSCITCHMTGRRGLAADDPDSDVGFRQVHSHLFAGVDVAITDWPDREIYQDNVECALAYAVNLLELELEPAPPFRVLARLETNAGHNAPSGASQDRRMWIELVAYDENDEVLCSIGAVPDDEPVATFRDERPCEVSGPWLFRDRIFDEDGEETHMFWRAAPSAEYDAGVTGIALTPQVPFAEGTEPPPHYKDVHITVGANAARVSFRMRMRPMDFDVLGELIESGHLEESIAGEIPTFTLAGTQAELLIEGGVSSLVRMSEDIDCRKAACKFRPDDADCEGYEAR